MQTVGWSLPALSTSPPWVLVPSASLQRIRRVARSLPFGLTDFFGFECRLGASGAPADVLFAVRRGQATALLECDRAWGPIVDFARSWSDPGSALHETVNSLWLEFDTERLPERGAVTAPNAFFGPTKDPGADGYRPDWWVDTAMATLRGRAVGRAQRASLSRCVAQLPGPANVVQVGAMVARPGAATRICIRGIDAPGIPGYLAAIGRPDEDGALRVLLDEFAPLVDEVLLNIDV